MKHKHNILVMSAAMAVAPFALSAQTDVQADEVQDSVYMVKTAFRFSNKVFSTYSTFQLSAVFL